MSSNTNFISSTPNLMQHSLVSGMLSRYSTGDPIIDPFIHMIIYAVIGIVIFNLQNILNLSNIQYYFGKFAGPVVRLITKLLHRDPTTINKQVVIDHITDSKKVNNLYKAVDWYLSAKSDTDYVHETPLKMICEGDIFNIKIPEISKKITNNRYKSIIYNGHEIFYLLASSLITVYADKERKRENYSITLNTIIKKDAKTDILEEFCNFCLNEYIKSLKPSVWSQKIFVNDSFGKWKSQESNNKRSIDTVILKNNQLDEIKCDIDDFLNSKQWYHDRDIPYTRGYLLYGEPGTGKTSIIKGLSTYTKRHMHYLMLNNITDDNQLLDLLRDIKYNETILIIEDIDCMTKIIETRKKAEHTKMYDELEKRLTEKIDSLDKRPKNEDSKRVSKLTLSGLLNAIDGIFNNDGRILIMTTNHPEVLDRALIRPGRIDRKVLFDYCNKQQICDIYKMMFDKEISISQLNGVDNSKYSPAEITSLFMRYRTSPEEAISKIPLLDEEKEFIPLTKKQIFSQDLIKKAPQQPLVNTAYAPSFMKYENNSTVDDEFMPLTEEQCFSQDLPEEASQQPPANIIYAPSFMKYEDNST